jgi:16S rRNA (uracil1498-N3)-methyltransferase
MTRRRWIADTVTGDQAALTGDHARHLAKVLRARVGQEFDILADGVVRLGRITAIHENRVEFLLGEEIKAQLTLPVIVALSIFKFDRMEWALEKCVELGVSKIVPLRAARTENHLAQASGKRLERWRRIATQASEQARRTTVAEVTDSITLEEAANLPAENRLVLAESESRLSLWQALQSGKPISGVALAIGPEGGWTNQELDLLNEMGWRSVTLGHTILRVETAAIAAVAVAAAAIQQQNSS